MGTSMTYPHGDDVKKQVLARVDFGSFYSSELPDLTKNGKESKAICPFHPDTDASLSVNLTDGVWHCFGCKAGGDVFKFIQQKYNVTFPDALGKLALSVGVDYHPPKKKLKSGDAEIDYLTEYQSKISGFTALAESPNDKGFVPVKPLYNPGRQAFVLVAPNEDKQRGKAGSYFEFNGDGTIIFFRSFYDVMADKGNFFSPQDARLHYDRKTGRAPVKVYDYHDDAGNLKYQVCRFETSTGKTFRQRRPDKDSPGGWSWDMAGMLRVPYRLPEILKADTVFIVEGEKDCDALASLGLVATCNPGGAGNWQIELNQYFAGKNVVIIPDNDSPGTAHAVQVAFHLHGLAATITVINLPGLAYKGDVSDWIASGGDKIQLLGLVAQTSQWSPPKQEVKSPQPDGKELKTKEVVLYGYNLTDVGNGRRLVDLFGQDLHYCHPQKKWFFWEGSRWQEDKVGHIDALTKKTIKSVYQQGMEASDSDSRKELLQHAKRSDGDRNRKAMITSARSESGIPVLPEQFDADGWALNVANGTVNLKTGNIRPHQRSDLITLHSPVKYDPGASCDTWENFLYQIFSNDHDLINFVQLAVGYALTGSTQEQCFFILYGSGSNGKSTFVNTIKAMLGTYALETPVSTLMLKPNGEIPNDLARLDGPRLVTARETEQGKRLAESLVKSLTGQDTISARFMYAEYFDFIPKFKLFLSTNHKPIIKGTDHGMWRRIRLIPFLNVYEGEEKDETLGDRLQAELPGILAWAVRGCQVWLETKRLPIPEAVSAATSKYRDEMDFLSDFFTECCDVGNGFSVQASVLYRAYTNWTQEKNPINQTLFGLNLKERGFESKRMTGGRKTWHGIKLIDSEQ